MVTKKNDIANQWPARFTFANLIGRSHAIQNAIRISRVAAKSSAAALILGESGVGKELFAQSIHNASGRSEMPFVSINCGAIPRELIEAELFGYVPNAFTGASSRGSLGKFSIASGGTLFLDEVADLSMDAQVKLLRAVSNSEIVRVGAMAPEKVDVRLVCATNKNMQKEIEEGKFREDLYYRINVFEIRVPPLRERLEDISEIVNYFIKLEAKNIFGPEVNVAVGAGFLEGLKKYSWPGNVRQLQAVLEREMYHLSGMSADTGAGCELTHLPDSIINDPGRFTPERCGTRITTLKKMEEDLIRAALSKYDWDFEKVCEALEISRATLYRKVALYRVSRVRK